jgi:hypothetical protein
MGLNLVTTNTTGATMSIKQLWWDWNPKRLRKLLAMKDGQINANVNLALHYHRDMVEAKKSLDQANQMLDVVLRELRVLRYELEAKEEAQNES